MDLTQLANLGEFIGGVAVLVTLLYLAVQVRHNTRAIVASAEISGADEALVAYGAMAQDSDLADLILKGATQYDALDEKERFQYGCHWQGVLFAHQTFYFLNERGALSKSVWGSYSRQFKAVGDMPGFVAWWQDARAVFDADFAAYFDQLLGGRSGS